MRDNVLKSKSKTALLLIDVINDLDFPQGEDLLRHALPAARKISALKARAKLAGVPAIYANDNFGQWRSDFSATVQHCAASERGRGLVELLRPSADDYFVLKPKHSGFYSTALAVLLEYLGVKNLVMVGFAGNICVLFSAHDAHMRDFRVLTPADCLASNAPEENEWALEQMKTVIGADIRPSEELDFENLARQG